MIKLSYIYKHIYCEYRKITHLGQVSTYMQFLLEKNIRDKDLNIYHKDKEFLYIGEIYPEREYNNLILRNDHKDNL